MKRISSQLKRQINNAGQIDVVDNDIKRLVWRVLLWSFGVLALLYVLLLGNMVRNIAERKNLEADWHSLSNEVGSLELAYLSLSNNIDLPLSYSMGFKETKATFATRQSLGLGITSSSFDNLKVLQDEI